MRKISLFIILILPFIINAQILEVSGIQEGVWNYDTILLVDEVVVPEDKSLTIAKGTRVIFQDYYSITIKGSLKAFGQKNDSIYFSTCEL